MKKKVARSLGKESFELSGASLKSALKIIGKQNRLQAFANGIGHGLIRGMVERRIYSLHGKMWNRIRRANKRMGTKPYKIETNGVYVKLTEL